MFAHLKVSSSAKLSRPKFPLMEAHLHKIIIDRRKKKAQVSESFCRVRARSLLDEGSLSWWCLYLLCLTWVVHKVHVLWLYSILVRAYVRLRIYRTNVPCTSVRIQAVCGVILLEEITGKILKKQRGVLTLCPRPNVICLRVKIMSFNLHENEIMTNLTRLRMTHSNLDASC